MNNKNNNGFLRNAFLYIIVIIAVVTGVQYFAGGSQSPSQQLSYTQLVKKIEDGKVKSITYQPDGSIIEVKGSYKKAEKVDTDLSLPFLGSASSETRSFTSTVLQNETTMQKLQSASEAADVNVKMIRESSSGAWISYLFSYLPLIGIAIFFPFPHSFWVLSFCVPLWAGFSADPQRIFSYPVPPDERHQPSP